MRGKHSEKTITLKKSHLAILAVLIVAIGVGAYFLVSYITRDNDSGSNPSGGMGFKLDSNAKDYDGDPLEDKGGETVGIKIPGYGTVHLPSGTTDVKMILLNPEGNPCYFTFELVVDGETYYTSDLVEPSKCIEDLTLTKPLKKGEYDAVLKISAYSLDESLTRMNGAHAKFTLVVH